MLRAVILFVTLGGCTIAPGGTDAVDSDPDAFDTGGDTPDRPDAFDADGDGVLSDVDCDDGAYDCTDDCVTDADGDGARDCDDPCVDVDGDGFGSGPACPDRDCDDGDAGRNPLVQEVCNGFDDDCDGKVDVADPSLDESTAVRLWPDLDLDGWGDKVPGTLFCAPPSGSWVERAGDCDDGDILVRPDGLERCNGIDDDCDDLLDDADPDVLDASPYLPDVDGDGFPDDAAPTFACTTRPGTVPDGPWTYDCDDADALTFPGAVDDDLCDGIDRACTGQRVVLVPRDAPTPAAAVASGGRVTACVSPGVYDGTPQLGEDEAIVGLGASPADVVLAPSAWFDEGGGALRVVAVGPGSSIENLTVLPPRATSATAWHRVIEARSAAGGRLRDVVVEGMDCAATAGPCSGSAVRWLQGPATLDGLVVRDVGSSGGQPWHPRDARPLVDLLGGGLEVRGLTVSDVEVRGRLVGVGTAVARSSVAEVWISEIDLLGEVAASGSVVASALKVLGPLGAGAAASQVSVEDLRVHLQPGSSNFVVGSLVDLSGGEVAHVDVRDVDVTLTGAAAQLTWAAPVLTVGGAGGRLDHAVVAGVRFDGLLRLPRVVAALDDVAVSQLTVFDVRGVGGDVDIDAVVRPLSGQVWTNVVLDRVLGTAGPATASVDASSGGLLSWAAIWSAGAVPTQGIGVPGSVLGGVKPAYVTAPLAGEVSDWDLRLAPGSALVDAGDPALVDPDGSRSAPGAYGGPAGEDWLR